MSSSTSPFDAIPPLHGALLVWTASAIIAGLVIGGAACLVAAVDPFDSQLSSFRFNINRVENFRRSNVALWAAYDISRDMESANADAEIVVLGDSRGESLRGSFTAARHFKIGSRTVYDLSFGGASLYEMISFFQHYRDASRGLKYVILVLPLSKLVASGGSESGAANNRSDAAFATVANPLRYLFDNNNLSKALTWLFLAKRAPEYVLPQRFERVAEVASLTQPACVSNAGTANRTQKYLKTELALLNLAKTQGIEVVDNVLVPFISNLREAGITPIIFVPPISPPVHHYMTENMQAYTDTVLTKLRALAIVYQVPADFEAALDWLDSVHVCYEVAFQLLPMVIEKAIAGDQNSSSRVGR